MSVQQLLAPVKAFGVAAPAAVGADLVTSGRLVGTAAALTALAGAVIGGLAVARSSGRGRAVAALAAGLTGLAVGGWVVLTADGGPGTGNGVVGGFAALAAGLIAMVLGGLALSRSGRAA